MNDFSIQLRLKFDGRAANKHQIDLYDLAQSLIGFQRSLALTTHLVLNDEVITQAPSLKGAIINAIPPREGSWEIYAIVSGIAGAAYTIATAPRETPLGHLVASAYDYVIKESLGFHVDFSSTLAQQHEKFKKENQSIKALPQHRFDSVIEKCQPAIKELHRPISASKTAKKANISVGFGDQVYTLGTEINENTYDYISYTERSDYPDHFHGWISSFNINTYKGRIFISEFKRPISFTVAENIRTKQSAILISNSLAENAKGRINPKGELFIVAFVNLSRSKQVKSLHIVEFHKPIDS